MLQKRFVVVLQGGSMPAATSRLVNEEGSVEERACLWHRNAITCIEDLKDVVFQADFEPLKMARDPLAGSIAEMSINGITFSSGAIAGKFSLR